MLIDCMLSSIKNIMRKKLRSALTVIGISIGVLSVVIISIIGEAGKIALNSELDSMGIGGLCVRASGAYGTIPFYSDELAKVQQNASVAAATPLMTSVTNIKVRDKSGQCIVWGIDSNTTEVVSLELLYGRLIKRSDINENSRVCIVDQAFAQQNYKRDNIVGKTVSLSLGDRFQDFTVVGVVSSGGNILQGLMGDVVPTFLYAPFTTISQLSKKQGFTQIVAKLNDDADESVAINSIIRDLGDTIANQSQASIKVENLNQQKDKLNGIVDAATLILAAIGGISLIVSGLSIMTVMLVTVNERTREIGIKKSIGAKKNTILLEFLVEALILSLIGSIIGTVGGVAIGLAGGMLIGMPIAFNIQGIAFCICFCVIMGVLFGVYPAIKAAKLKPVDALGNHS